MPDLRIVPPAEPDAKQAAIKRGTVTADKVCYHCDKRGILSFMAQDPPKLVKEPKPRRTRPKAVK